MEIDDKDVPDDMLGNEVLSLEFENFDLHGLLDSISTENSHDWNLQYPHDEHFNELSKVYSSASSNDPFTSQLKIGEEGMMTSLQGDSSYLSDLLNDPIEEINDVLLNSLIDKNPCFDSWSGEISSFDLLEQQLAPEIGPQEVIDVCFAEENAFSSIQLPVQDSALTSLNNQHSSKSIDVADVNFPLSSDTLHDFSENLEPVDMSEEFLKFSSMDDLFQWFAPSATLSESIEFNPSSSMVGSSSSDIPVACLTGNNSFASTINSIGKETSAVTHSSENNLLDNMELDLSFDQADQWWGNIITPMVNAAPDSSFSQCLSEVNIGTMSSTGKRLFSELGIEELLRGESSSNPYNSSDFGYGLSSNKRQLVELSAMNRNPMSFANLAGNEVRANLMQPVSDLENSSSSLLGKKDTFLKSQVGMLSDDRHSIHIGKDVPVSLQKPKEHTKPTGRGARPKESTRPRPKDRQQIQDCIKELRGIIPSGGKVRIKPLMSF